MELSRGDFLKAGFGTLVAVATGCASDTSGDVGGTGGAPLGSGGSGSGGSPSGGAASGGAPASGGTTGVGGGSGGSLASGGSGGGTSSACAAEIDTLSSMTTGAFAHDHRLIVSSALIAAGQDANVKTSTLPTDPGYKHCHQVTITAADFATLAAGGTVKKITCNEDHSHEYVLSCAASADAPVTPTTCVDENLGVCAE